MFTVSKELHFSSAHSIKGHTGGCEQIHGHNYRVKVVMGSSELDAMGMVMDFNELNHAMKQVANRFDHQNLNRVPPFDAINPTAENLARHFYEQISGIFKDHTARVIRVEVYETDASCAIYMEDRA